VESWKSYLLPHWANAERLLAYGLLADNLRLPPMNSQAHRRRTSAGQDARGEVTWIHAKSPDVRMGWSPRFIPRQERSVVLPLREGQGV
jgi:hypothetical protein